MNEQPQKKKLSAIIACYLDAQAIPIMYHRLTSVFRKIDVAYEIIFVNDCSPDNTRDILADLCSRDRKVIAIHHTRSFGSQSAFTSGMQISSGNAVILLDGDLQDPPELIEEFHKKWREGYAVVYGVRSKRKASIFLRVADKLFYRIFRAASYIAIPADAGDFSLMDKCVVDAIKALPENNRFLRGLRAWVGYRQTGVPYVRPERMFGRSTNSLLKNLGWARKAIFSFSYMPLDLIAWLAFLVMGGSCIAGFVQVTLRLFYPHLAPRGFSTLILLILFIGGVQLLCLGIIGSYMAHMYDETKRRPPYIVESYLNYSPSKSVPQKSQ